jgi:tape measure domain-containing protein
MGNILEYALRLNDSGFTGPLGRARTEQARFVAEGQRIGQTGARFSAITPMIMGTVAALGAATAAAVGFAVKTAASTEQTLVQFKTLTGSMDQAKATLAELQDLGASTPFELPQLADAAKKLLAARVPTTALRSELTALGNISAATGADLGNLATVYGQMAGKGKIYAEDMQQFVEAGAGEIKQVLAESLKVSTSALNDLMSDGKVGFSDMQRAVQQLAGTQGKWASSMDEQSRTSIGLLSTLKDNVMGIFREMGQPLNDGPVKAWLNSAVNATKSAGTMIAASIQQGRVGELLYHSLVLGTKMGVDAVVGQMRKLPDYLSSSFETISQLFMAAISGNFDVVKSTIKGFMDGSFETDKSAQMKFFAELRKGQQATTAETVKTATAAKDWAKALDSVAAAEDKASAGKAGRGGAAATSEGRGRIRSLRDGSTVAASSDRNTTFGPVSQFARLNQRVLSGPNEGQFANAAFGGSGVGPQGKGRLMGGGLDALRTMNPGDKMGTFKRPLATAPNLTPPAAAKATAERQKDVTARVQGQSSGGGGGGLLEEIKRLVSQIEAHTAKLEVVR